MTAYKIDTLPRFRQFQHDVLVSGESLQKPDRLLPYIDARYPIVAKLAVAHVPFGSPPVDIRKDWIGTDLPIRFQYPSHDGAAIWPVDAIQTLDDSGRTVAAEYWRNYFTAQANQVPQLEEGFSDYPEFMANLGVLLFNPECGEIQAA